MKKMRIIVALTCVLALGLVFTGCSCTKSSTTNSTSSQSASNSNVTKMNGMFYKCSNLSKVCHHKTINSKGDYND